MAQTSNALRDPQMDEILTSIREIIEENTAQDNQSMNRKVEASRIDADSNDQTDKASVSVQDAMQALAARIGLREAEAAVVQSESTPNTPPSEPEYATEQAEPVIETAAQDAAYHTDAGQSSEEPVLPVFEAAEQVVSDVLRPLLAAWLERNLPSMVDRLLKEEMVRLLKQDLWK